MLQSRSDLVFTVRLAKVNSWNCSWSLELVCAVCYFRRGLGRSPSCADRLSLDATAKLWARSRRCQLLLWGLDPTCAVVSSVLRPSVRVRGVVDLLSSPAGWTNPVIQRRHTVLPPTLLPCLAKFDRSFLGATLPSGSAVLFGWVLPFCVGVLCSLQFRYSAWSSPVILPRAPRSLRLRCPVRMGPAVLRRHAVLPSVPLLGLD
ncbi:hypothetical protein EOD39_10736 [Acipenser ruthenus]|uniref:Uncharacterized protein n=1 Tax=Acipenser ruthenus TaxID=7906 RepID=A0A662YV10_ACIRT|nr:hypothetical protein EOD39_10736 [Acipenser ruthenus]